MLDAGHDGDHRPLMNEARALEAARRARRVLARGETRDAAWLALWSTELDPNAGLGLAVAARILHEVSGDALATLVTREACQRGLPEPDNIEVERFHRIDLWSRGLLSHASGQSLLPASAFDDSDAFTPTDSHDSWLKERADHWGSSEGACRALRRLLGALSDAWEMPCDVDDPLRVSEPWEDMPAYASWKKGDPLSVEDFEDLEAEPVPLGVTVISDYWTDHTIHRLETRGRLQEAMEVAEHWLDLRPGRMSPKISLMRLCHRTGDLERLRSIEREVIDTETEDLNELEEARVGLGFLKRYAAQKTILDRMNELAPGQPVILANRGAALLELGQTEDAETDLELALQLDPNSGAALTNLGLLRLHEEDYIAARALLEQAKTIFPNEAQLRYYLASCFRAQSNIEGALREIRVAIELDPSFGAAHNLLAQLEKQRS